MIDTPKTPEDVKRLVRDNDITIVDLKFTDLPGTFQHFSIHTGHPPFSVRNLSAVAGIKRRLTQLSQTAIFRFHARGNR